MAVHRLRYAHPPSTGLTCTASDLSAGCYKSALDSIIPARSLYHTAKAAQTQLHARHSTLCSVTH
jgi:hypothetical protein